MLYVCAYIKPRAITMGLQHNAINENEQSMRMTQHCTHKKRYIEGSLQEQNLQK